MNDFHIARTTLKDSCDRKVFGGYSSMVRIPLVLAALFLLGLSHVPGMGFSAVQVEAASSMTFQAHSTSMSGDLPCEQGGPGRMAQGCYKICSVGCAATVLIEMPMPRFERTDDVSLSVESMNERSPYPEPHPPKLLQIQI